MDEPPPRRARPGPTDAGPPSGRAPLPWGVDDEWGDEDPGPRPLSTRIGGWLAPMAGEARGAAAVLLVALVGSAVVTLGPWRARGPVAPSPAALVGDAVSRGAVADGAAPAASAAVGAATEAGALGGTVGAVVVHVTGAVRTPGVVRLAAGARIADAVAAAGGLVDDADVVRVNLARVVTDGEQVHVPRVGEASPVPGPDAEGSGARTADGRLDINRASVEELMSLPGIGPAKAAAIAAHRERVGGFSSVEELRDVPGIGEATFRTIAPLVVVR